MMKANPGSGAPEGRGDEQVRREGDVVLVRVRGVLDLRAMKTILDMGDAIVAEYGYMLVLADAAQTSNIDADARKLQSERLKKVVHPSHSAIYGASAAARLTSNLVQRGIEILTGKTYPISFHASEAEARAMIEQKRAELQQSSGAAARRGAPP